MPPNRKRPNSAPIQNFPNPYITKRILQLEHINSLTRVQVSRMRDLRMLQHRLKTRKAIFYSRFDLRKSMSAFLAREMFRVDRENLVISKWTETGIYDYRKEEKSEPLNRFVYGEDSGLYGGRAKSMLKRYHEMVVSQDLSDKTLFRYFQTGYHSVIVAEEDQITSMIGSNYENSNPLHKESDVHGLFYVADVIFQIREYFMDSITHVLKYIQRIKLNKQDPRDVYRWVFAYTSEDQGAANDCLFEVMSDIKTWYIDVLENLLITSKEMISEKLEATYAEMKKKGSLKKLIKKSKRNFDDDRLTQETDLDLSRDQDDPKIDIEKFSSEIETVAKSIRRAQDSKKCDDVTSWIDKKIFWDNQKKLLKKKRQQEIDEHREFMTKWKLNLLQQKKKLEQLYREGDAGIIKRWRACEVIQRFIRGYQAFQWKKRRLCAIAVLQRSFRVAIAKSKYCDLKFKTPISIDEYEQLWHQRQQLYKETEVSDSQVVYCHILLRKTLNETFQQIQEEQSAYQKRWDKFAKKTMREHLKRALNSEWVSENVGTNPPKTRYTNIVTGVSQWEHPNAINAKRYLQLEEKRHLEQLRVQQENLLTYQEQLQSQELQHRNVFCKVLHEKLKEISGVELS